MSENRRDLSLVDTLRSEADELALKARRLRRNGGRPAGSEPEDQTVVGLNSDVEPNRAGVGTPDSKALGQPDGQDDQVELRSTPVLKALPQDVAEDTSAPLTMPQRARGSLRLGGILSFFLCVVLPTIAAGYYYFAIASNQYVVEWRYTVRDSSTAASTSTVASSVMTSLLGTSSAASTPDNYAVAEYIKSEQAIIDLEKRVRLTALYGRPSIDFFSRFNTALPIEKFARYWDNMVVSTFDQITGTALAQVRAFSPDDAYLIANTLVELTEDLVNETAQRPQREAVKYAEYEVARAEDRVKRVRRELLEYRNKAAVIEPNSSVVLSNATVATTLRQTLAQYQSELGTMLQGGLGQNASQVLGAKRRIKAVQDQIKDVEADITKVKQGNQPLSEIVARYEELDLERQFAQGLLTSTVQSLEQARSNASARRLFIMPYVKPALPQSSTYPNRTVAVLTVAGVATMLWMIALLIGRSIREHLA